GSGRDARAFRGRVLAQRRAGASRGNRGPRAGGRGDRPGRRAPSAGKRRRRSHGRRRRVSAPRVLVVRSGANPFVSFAKGSRLAIVEKVSHTIEPVEPERGALESPSDWVIFTSQVAVE